MVMLQLMQLIGVGILAVILFIAALCFVFLILGILAGIFRAAMRFGFARTGHRLNKKNGKNFLIVSGDDPVIREVYSICVRTLKNAEQRQAQAREAKEKVGISDESA